MSRHGGLPLFISEVYIALDRTLVVTRVLVHFRIWFSVWILPRDKLLHKRSVSNMKCLPDGHDCILATAGLLLHRNSLVVK